MPAGASWFRCPLWSWTRPDAARVVAEATVAIGAEAFAAQFGAGAAMSREDALTTIEGVVSGSSVACQRGFRR
ncbi:hypothetical protein [Microbispora rosea]